MRYVRFWRGSLNDFERIAHKQEDTMYFVIQPDTNSFIIYLGDNELLSGDDLNSSSIDALEDVITSKNLHDRQVLMYDALQECWVNASLDKAAGAYVGPTADFQGLPGMLPGAPAGSSDLFFRSDGKWVEQHIEKINNLEGLEHYELIGNITANWDSINKNDLIIIEETNYDTAYYYTGSEWISLSNKKLMNEIEKRPVGYKETVTEPLEITWDGFVGQKPVFWIDEDAPLVYVKVSDLTPTLEELDGGTAVIQGIDGGQAEGEVKAITVTNYGVSAVALFPVDDTGLDSPLAMICYENATVLGQTVSPGIWLLRLMYEEGSFVHISSLSISSFTYEKIHKLDNKFVDAEWVATETKGSGPKEFRLRLLQRLSDFAALDIYEILGAPTIKLDERFYTADELMTSAITIADDSTTVQCGATQTYTGELEDGTETVTTIIPLVMTDDSFMLIGISQDTVSDGLSIHKGLYLSCSGNITGVFSEATDISLYIHNVNGQTLPNKLPNKFLDMDWVPKSETTETELYSGSGQVSNVSIPFHSGLLEEKAVLTITCNGIRYDVMGFLMFGYGVAHYVFLLPNSNDKGVELSVQEGAVTLSADMPDAFTISIQDKTGNKIPNYFLPDGVGSTVRISIGENETFGDHVEDINAAWNSGARVIVKYRDHSLTLLYIDGLFLETLIGIEGGSLYGYFPGVSFQRLAWFFPKKQGVFYNNGAGLESIVLNSTLTEGSALPAQEGATFTAIKNLENTIGTLNQDLENRLNGGT